MKRTILIVLLALLLALLASVFITTANAAKYPPSVNSIVKLRNSVQYKDGHTMTWLQNKRFQRNYSNALSKNRGCKSCISRINLGAYYAAHARYTKARYTLNKGRDLAWAYRRALQASQ